MKIVLDVGLDNLIAIVIFDLVVGLRICRDVAEQKVGESISSAHRRVGGIEGEGALDLRRILLIFLRDDSIGAELQRVLADNLGDVVAQRVGGIGVVPRLVGRVGLKRVCIISS